MTNINLVQVMGRLTRDPELRKTQSGAEVAHMSVASNYTWKDQAGQKQEEVEFHSVVAFGRTAEVIAQYFHKGDEIYIQGRLKTSKWEAKDGGQRSRTEIIAERFEFGQKARGSEGGQAASGEENQAAAVPAEDEINIEDIPF